MKSVDRFEVGKHYQFTGEPICIRKGESILEKAGAVFEALIPNDIEIVHNWMDRGVRKCVYVDSITGTSAVFEDIYFKKNGRKIMLWTVVRSYDCYLKAGMFQKVEVE